MRALLLGTLSVALLYQATPVRNARADNASTPGVSPPPPGHPAAAQPDYRPSFGDLMTMAVQPRHIKLGVAGRAANWAYAAYEVNELRNAFARIARTIPLYNGADTQALFVAMTRASLDSVTAAIKDRNAGEFHRAYAQLTAACNACHVSQRHAFVVITVPLTSPYADQDLRARAR
ncbi:MAG: cytochrome family protein [Steroidobacteraceae bacterium]